MFWRINLARRQQLDFGTLKKKRKRRRAQQEAASKFDTVAFLLFRSALNMSDQNSGILFTLSVTKRLMRHRGEGVSERRSLAAAPSVGPLADRFGLRSEAALAKNRRYAWNGHLTAGASPPPWASACSLAPGAKNNSCSTQRQRCPLAEDLTPTPVPHPALETHPAFLRGATAIANGGERGE